MIKWLCTTRLDWLQYHVIENSGVDIPISLKQCKIGEWITKL